MYGLKRYTQRMLPSAPHQRRWVKDQKIMPSVRVTDTHVHIHNLRDFHFYSYDSFDPHYKDMSFDMRRIQRVWFGVDLFYSLRFLSHAFLTFEFEGNKFVSVSVEARREKNMSFSPVRGMQKTFELIYVIATEHDIVSRMGLGKHGLHLYPMKLRRQEAAELFLKTVRKAASLNERPEYYHTFKNSCITTLVGHINSVKPGALPWNWRMYFPGHIDKYLYTQGLLNTKLTWPEARIASYLPPDMINSIHGDSAFPLKLRDKLGTIPPTTLGKFITKWA